jgi:hypothetical protein
MHLQVPQQHFEPQPAHLSHPQLGQPFMDPQLQQWRPVPAVAAPHYAPMPMHPVQAAHFAQVQQMPVMQQSIPEPQHVPPQADIPQPAAPGSVRRREQLHVAPAAEPYPDDIQDTLNELRAELLDIASRRRSA